MDEIVKMHMWMDEIIRMHIWMYEFFKNAYMDA